MKLTPAQAEALHVLAEHTGRRVRASKRRSTLTPAPNVNHRAVEALVRLKLARHEGVPPSRRDDPMRNYLTYDEYAVTAAGVAEWAERAR